MCRRRPKGCPPVLWGAILLVLLALLLLLFPVLMLSLAAILLTVWLILAVFRLGTRRYK